jgi:hypothetical protein
MGLFSQFLAIGWHGLVPRMLRSTISAFTRVVDAVVMRC